jgi:rhodanese-related sulfurtransferase
MSTYCERCMRIKFLTAAFYALMTIVPAVMAEVRDIDNDGLRNLKAKGTPMIDVRTPQEWFNTGIIPNSMLLTFFDEQGNYDIERWLHDLGDHIDYMQPFVLICDVGVRTEAISRVLSNQLKLPVVYNLKDGIQSWIQKGFETVPPPYLMRIPDRKEEKTNDH